MPCPGGNRVALHDTADRFRQAPVGEIRGELLLLCTRLSPAASKPLAVVSLVWGLPATPPAPPRYALIYAKRRKKIKYVNFFFFFSMAITVWDTEAQLPPPKPGGDGGSPSRCISQPVPELQPPPPPSTLPTFPWGSRQAAKRCRGGLGCSSKPLSSPRPSPPSQPVSRTLPTLSPSILTAAGCAAPVRFGNQ